MMHQLVEEIMAVISAAGIAPDKAVLNQLKLALDSIYMSKNGTSALLQNFAGLTRSMTALGGGLVREYVDITNASTVGGIEIGVVYNCAINTATGIWAGRDINDICWLEKWHDVAGTKEFWFAPIGAAGAVPVWQLVFGIDTVNNMLTGPASLLGHGQCRLVKSGVNLLLQPFNGNKLIINGQAQKIPSAGIAITPASLPAKATGFVPMNLSAVAGTYNITTVAAHNLAVGDSVWLALASAPAGTPQLAFNSTVASVLSATVFTFVSGTTTVTSGAAGGSGGALIYHYAYMNAGVIAIESVATSHSTDATTGVEIKTGDATRTLVGMSIGGAFTDTPQSQYVRGWFNRAPIKGYSPLAAARTTASTTVVETNAADRCQFLLWSGESVHISGSSNCANTTVGATIGFTAGWDGSGGVGIGTSISPVVTANYYSIISVYPVPISGLEGFHMVSPFINTSVGTASYGSGGVSVWS
ncbi:MAG: hypothetical protein WCK93_07445 [Nitrosomonadales bacterium]